MARPGKKAGSESGRRGGVVYRKDAPSQADILMIVALDLFSKRDFASVTIKDIAQAARVNSALIYYYFRNKEDLFRASIEHAILLALDNYARLNERHADPVDLVNNWFDNNVELISAMRKLIKIMLDYSNSMTRIASVEALIRQFYKAEMSILASGVRQGIGLGLFKDVDPEQAAEFASIHLDGIVVASMVRGNLRLQAAIDDLRDQFWAYVGYRDNRRRRGARQRLIAVGR